ncbi:MAG: hypothetical protein D6B28_06240 [Gammaproteobacteria bacterium]|nr:MAG: hypothetical protein D6B28_06240 [Gammaproteobacteria bacterium]
MQNDNFDQDGMNGIENNNSNFQAPPPPKSNAGKYIGIGCLVIVLIFIGLGYAGYRTLIGYMEDAVTEYTESESRELPQPLASASEAGGTLDIFDEFVYSVKNDIAVESLVLDAEQINQIINYHPDFSTIADHIFIRINEDLLFAEVSIPLGELRELSELFVGRYLNGAVELAIEMKNQRFEVYAESIEVKGQQVPEEYMSKIRTENLAKDFNRKQENKELIEKLDSISIRDGVIEIVPKNKGAI